MGHPKASHIPKWVVEWVILNEKWVVLKHKIDSSKIEFSSFI
jgi:hypothetical protein